MRNFLADRMTFLPPSLQYQCTDGTQLKKSRIRIYHNINRSLSRHTRPILLAVSSRTAAGTRDSPEVSSPRGSRGQSTLVKFPFVAG